MSSLSLQPGQLSNDDVNTLGFAVHRIASSIDFHIRQIQADAAKSSTKSLTEPLTKELDSVHSKCFIHLDDTVDRQEILKVGTDLASSVGKLEERLIYGAHHASPFPLDEVKAEGEAVRQRTHSIVTFKNAIEQILTDLSQETPLYGFATQDLRSDVDRSWETKEQERYRATACSLSPDQWNSASQKDRRSAVKALSRLRSTAARSSTPGEDEVHSIMVQALTRQIDPGLYTSFELAVGGFKPPSSVHMERTRSTRSRSNRLLRPLRGFLPTKFSSRASRSE